MKKLEIIIAGLALTAVTMNLYLVPGGAILTVLLISVLLMLYFYSGLALFHDIPFKDILKKQSYSLIPKPEKLIARFMGIAMAITLVGFLFVLQSWPGAKFNLMVGLFVLLIVNVAAYIKYVKGKSPFYLQIFKRAAIVGAIGLFFLFSPDNIVRDFKFRDHPAYLDLLNKLAADPDNEELWKKLQEERSRIKPNN